MNVEKKVKTFYRKRVLVYSKGFKSLKVVTFKDL